MIIRICLTGILLASVMAGYSQNGDSTADRIAGFPHRFLDKINGKTTSLDRMLTRQTQKYLHRLARKEAKLKKKLYAYDSASAAKLFAASPDLQYSAYIQKLKQDSAGPAQSMGPEYLPYADSLNGTLGFLNSHPQMLAGSGILPDKVQSTLNQYQQLSVKLQDADQIKQYIQARKTAIAACLAQYTHLPAGLSDIYQRYSKQSYYYSDQLREYRNMLNDPDKMMQTALAILNKIPAFSSFMQKNGFLAGLFSVPENYGSASGLVGLQTRDQVLSIIQSQVSQGGAGGAAVLQNSLQAASQDISKLQDKLNALGAGSGDMDMPGFKPNEEKKKTIFHRIEYGVNLQTTHASDFFVTTTDIGLSLGFKLDEKNRLGAGLAYKLGWGSGINHIALSSQGLALRSFIDLNVKKTWYATAGFEMNYQQPFNAYAQLQHLQAWQQSGLAGVTKIVSMKTKFFKQTKLQLLFDFLSFYQLPRTQPLKFRVGYNFLYNQNLS